VHNLLLAALAGAAAGAGLLVWAPRSAPWIAVAPVAMVVIVSGRARRGRVVTHHGGLDDAPGLDQRFDRREDGVVKAVLHA
jgi:hypothetical protein